MDPMVIGILVVVTLLLAYTLYLVMQPQYVYQMHLAPIKPGPAITPTHIIPSVLPPVSQKANMQANMQHGDMKENMQANMQAPSMPASKPSPLPSLIPSSMQAPSQAWMTDSTQMQSMPHKYMGECDSSKDCPMFQHCNAVGNCASNESCRY